MKNGVISLGAALVDFVPTDHTNTLYQKSPGGAPANVAVGMARLGLSVYFVGKVGDDFLGHFLKGVLETNHVDISYLRVTNQAKTGIRFVTVNDSGERSFDFYNHSSADTLLVEYELDESMFSKAKIFHFVSSSLIHEPSKTATLRAIQFAKKNGILISYAPNLCLSLWSNDDIARETILSVLPEVDIVIMSADELSFLLIDDAENLNIAVHNLLIAYNNIKLVAITCEETGSYLFNNIQHVHIEALNVEVVDQSGAGDAYVSGLLYKLHESKTNLEELSVIELKQIGEFASVSAGLAVSTTGVTRALPTLEEVKKIIGSSTIEFTTVDYWDEILWNQVRSIYHQSFKHGAKPEHIIKNMFKNKIGTLHVAKVYDEVVGMALTGETRDAQTLLIDYLAVTENRRGEGIGKQIIDYLEMWALVEKHYDSMIIEVEFEKSVIYRRRIDFWKKCGFTLTNYIHHYKVVPEPYQAMFKKLCLNSTLPSTGEKLFKLIERFHRKCFRGKATE